MKKGGNLKAPRAPAPKAKKSVSSKDDSAAGERKRQIKREEKLVDDLKKEAVAWTQTKVREGVGLKKNESVMSHYTPAIAAQKRKDFVYGFTHPNDFKHTWNFVKGAAMDVLRLAPAALNIGGLLMTKHAPTQAAALAAGRSDLIAKYTAPAGGPIPLQQGGLGNFSNCVGISSMKAISKKGLLYGQRCVGMDKLLDVPEVNPITGAVWAEGDLMASVDLNPTGAGWSGTALVQQARIYNRYRVNKMCFLYATNVAATDEGSIIMSVTPDPDSQYTGVGITGTQLATAVTGADVCSIWAAGCTSWYGDKKQNFYARPDGTDPRFTSPGILNVVCNSVMNVDGSGTTIGTIYVLYDIELTERSLEDSNQFQQFYAYASAVSGQTGLLPFGTAQAFNGQSNGFLSTVVGLTAAEIVNTPELNTVLSTAYPGGSLATQMQYSLVGTKGVLSGLPIGDYLYHFTATGTTITAGANAVVNVGNPYYTSFFVATITAVGGGAIFQIGLLRVLKQTTSGESYLDLTMTAAALATAKLWLCKFGDAAPYQVVPQSLMKMEQEIAILRKQFADIQGKKHHEALEQAYLPGSVPIYQDAVTMTSMMPAPNPLDQFVVGDKGSKCHRSEIKASERKLSSPEVDFKAMANYTDGAKRHSPFQMGEVVSFKDVSEFHMKWINQHDEQTQPSEKGFAFVIWSNEPEKLKVLSINRLLVDCNDHTGSTLQNERARTHNYEVAVRVFIEWQMKKSGKKYVPVSFISPASADVTLSDDSSRFV